MNEGPDKRKEDKRRNDEHGKEGDERRNKEIWRDNGGAGARISIKPKTQLREMRR